MVRRLSLSCRLLRLTSKVTFCMFIPIHESISDWTHCRRCWEETCRLHNGDIAAATKYGARGYADRYFNGCGTLWAVCSVHNVRWYVTRELGGFPEERDAPGTSFDLPVVERVETGDPDGFSAKFFAMIPPALLPPWLRR